MKVVRFTNKILFVFSIILFNSYGQGQTERAVTLLAQSAVQANNKLVEYKNEIEDLKRINSEIEGQLEKSANNSKNLSAVIFSLMGFCIIGVVMFVLLNRKRKALTESTQLQNELAQQKERAERSEDVKRRFLANMSHEIRTPMHAVTGMTSLVLETELTDKQRSYLEKVRKASNNLLQIINDILDFSKIEVGKMELEEIDFSISEVIDQVKQVIKHKADEKGLEFIVKIDPAIEDIVLGDPLRLNQILINLAGNAIKFTEKGSVFLEVTKVGEKVKFAIIDTGIGIPEEKLRFVFDSFNQANASDTRKYGGTGLVLSISQQLVELMGGSIGIKSSVGRGTTFYFEINFELGDQKRYEDRISADENIDGSILDGLKIIIADDNEYNRIVARDTLLSRSKVTILEAENGQEAIDILDESVDVILMDAQMPVLNGFDATRKIRNSKDVKINSVPIIALTASVMRVELDRCIEAGMNAYIPKPFKTHDLISGIAKPLGIEIRHDKSITIKPLVNQKSQTDTVTNLNYLRDFCEGDEVKMEKYIGIFIKSTPDFLEKLENLIKKKDTEGIANHIHGFNTKLTMMGMKETKSLSIELENELRDRGNLSVVNERLGILSERIKLAQQELAVR
jgi:signal transduction histidine kinase/CheY-like chemotaxis protein